MPDAERLTEVVSLRLTKDETDILCRGALRRGQSVNAYVRGLLRERGVFGKVGTGTSSS